MEAIQNVTVRKAGFTFESEKEHYHVKICDKFRPNATISCKCTMLEDSSRLELHQVELTQVRHLVVDLSCLEKDLDLRLMMSTKRILTELTDEEEVGIKEILKSAVVDPDAKAGLRWPRGKDSFGDRFSVVGVWHTKYKAYQGLKMRLKLRNADRFNFLTGGGDSTREVTLSMEEISRMFLSVEHFWITHFIMACVPPNKRHSKGQNSAPTSSSLFSRFERNFNLRPNSNRMRRKDQHTLYGTKILYANKSISRWWVVGLTDDDRFPDTVQLKPVSCEAFERRRGEKPLVLGHVHDPSGDASDFTKSSTKAPWHFVTEKIKMDLESSFRSVMSEKEAEGSLNVKPLFVARFGKLFFHALDTILKNSADDTYPRKNRSFYTNVPEVYMEAIQQVTVQKGGFVFESEREQYHVKICDKLRPNVTMSCKCILIGDSSRLELQKVELNPLRHLVADLSCLEKDLDLRLMMSTKRVFTELTDEEADGIKEILKSAILDPNVRAGLRWPLEKESFGDRFSVVGVWHTKHKAYKGLKMRLKLRNADRFDFLTGGGEVTREVSLKMVEISRMVRDGKAEINQVNKMLVENLKFIWDHFLSCDGMFA